MASRNLYAVTVPSYMPAFTVTPGGDNNCVIKFALSKFNGTRDFKNLHLTIRKQDNGLNVLKQDAYDSNTYPYYTKAGIFLDVPCNKLRDEDGYYSVTIPDAVVKTMSSNTEYPGFVPGTIYKVQLRLSNASYGDYVNEITAQIKNYNENHAALLKTTEEALFSSESPTFSEFISYLSHWYVDNNKDKAYDNFLTLVSDNQKALAEVETLATILVTNDLTKESFPDKNTVKRLYISKPELREKVSELGKQVNQVISADSIIKDPLSSNLLIAKATAEKNEAQTKIAKILEELKEPLTNITAGIYQVSYELPDYIITTDLKNAVKNYATKYVTYITEEDDARTVTAEQLEEAKSNVLTLMLDMSKVTVEDVEKTDEKTFNYYECYMFNYLYLAIFEKWVNTAADESADKLIPYLSIQFTELKKIYKNIDISHVYKLQAITDEVAKLILSEEKNKLIVELYNYTPSIQFSSDLMFNIKEYYTAVQNNIVPVVKNEYTWLTENSDQFSEWSTICIVKATGIMRLQVPDYNQFDSKTHIYDDNEDIELFVDNMNFKGVFTSEVDASESLYTYRVKIYGYNEDNQLVLKDDSGNLTPNEAEEGGTAVYYNSAKALPARKPYKVVFSFVTINYNEGSWEFDLFYNSSLRDVKEIRVMTVDNNDETEQCNDEPYVGEAQSVYDIHSNIHEDERDKTGVTVEGRPVVYRDPPYIMKSITNIADEEAEGRVALCLYHKYNEPLSTNVVVRRASSKDNYATWEDIRVFNFIDEYINPENKEQAKARVFYDYTIESGVFYKYCTETEDEYGNRTALYMPNDMTPVVRYFDSAYLLGENERQLNLKFDNTMTSYKIAVSESKTDTLGNKYPIISKNGNLGYKTFPIAGLISLHMDEQNLFTDPVKLYGEEYYEALKQDQGEYHNSMYSHQYERTFRDEVVKFLTDGKVKLFKSFAEGNVLVRLTDVTLTPKQELGRLIYSFTANASEIGEATFENCVKYNLTSVGDYIRDFQKKEYRIGQLSGTFKTKGFVNELGEVSAGDDLIKLIYDKYNFKGQNIAGHFYSAQEVVGMRIEIHNKPLRTPLNIRGFVIEYNGDQIYVTQSMNGIYEFDNNIRFSSGDSIYIYADVGEGEVSEDYILTMAYEKYGVDTLAQVTDEMRTQIILDAYRILETVDMTVDFVYELKIGKTKAKQIKTSTQKRALGQLHEWFEPGQSLFTPIYNKYYFESDHPLGNGEPQFRRLNNIYGIRIEANPGSLFNIESDDGDLKTFEIGQTGVLNFYDLVDISKINYVGWKKDKAGNIDYTRGTNVILDYFFYTIFGQYQEEE